MPEGLRTAWFTEVPEESKATEGDLAKRKKR